MKRRGFLKLLGLGGAAVTTGSLIEESTAKSQELFKGMLEGNSQQSIKVASKYEMYCTAVTSPQVASKYE